MPRPRKRIRRLMLLAGVLCVLGAAAAWVTRPLPAELVLSTSPTPVGLITAKDGRPLFQIIDQQGGIHRPLTKGELPEALCHAVVATEDARFYRHPGVDPWAIVRAAYANVTSGRIVSGASTITQQAARNLFMTPEERQQRSVARKVREAILALRLERTLSKDEILLLYLNSTAYGRLATGVAAAAEAYFGKPVADLSLAESAFLAGLPQAPGHYDPDRDLATALARQRTVLDLMVAAGYVTQEQAEQAAGEPLQFAPYHLTMEAPHFAIMVREQVGRLVSAEELARGGLVVRTTLDLDLQRAAEGVVRRQLAELNQPEPGSPQRVVNHAAVLVLDTDDGAVRALVGSPDYTEATHGAINAVLASRQPGSAIKPLLYLAAFERGYLPSTMLLDVQASYQAADGAPYTPENYDLRYHGPVSARTALACSYNAAAVSLADQVGVDALVDVGRRLGIRSWEQLAVRDLALALGAGELTLWELAQAYGVLARAGTLVPTYVIESIHADDGRLLYQAGLPAPVRVVDAQAAYLVSHVLADEAARAPAFGIGGVLSLPFEAAVKTGTTTDWRDNWTVGYSAAHVVGVWVGNADGTPMAHATGITGAAPIWREVMLAGHPRDPGPLLRPDGLEKVAVCALSGQLPGPGCVHRRVELFPAGQVPVETCDLHVVVAYDRLNGALAGSDTPPERIGHRTVTRWPVEALAWAQDEGLLETGRGLGWEESLEATSLGLAAEEIALRWLRPASGTRYHLASDLPATAQQIELVLAAPSQADELTVRWNDEVWVTLTDAPYRVRWQLVPGEHCFVAEMRGAGGAVARTAPLCIEVREAVPEADG
ncbi:MAG: penicillin-binding protein 1C [Anaerolineae bacterium]|jgi:1A family penicillin-binding protein